ncbi:hypothetical protein HNY73_017476 [Argiope bruennichi]|uniref:Uncharacterized protein n=1 Tax=Argiope bruennichi TaxID=94029 RepID=A0A8T0EEL4_ARGBR|nr:hypothetical protein HNY73_017476 [Argiope bruennichi]
MKVAALVHSHSPAILQRPTSGRAPKLFELISLQVWSPWTGRMSDTEEPMDWEAVDSDEPMDWEEIPLPPQVSLPGRSFSPPTVVRPVVAKVTTPTPKEPINARTKKTVRRL